MNDAISRSDDRITFVENYREIMVRENHHSHEIVMVNDVIRWKADPVIRILVDNCDFNNVIIEMLCQGITKNHESYRKLYRDIGYSLSGYWEIFYWDMNNEECEEYKFNSEQLTSNKQV